MPVTTGQRLGRYRLGRRVGSGGMAEVWEAQDESLHRPVAVKVILDAVSREPTFTERFVREARTIAGLEHPHILPIYDFGQEGDAVYLVMPLVSGGSLKDRLGGPVSPAAALDWISGVASALDYAHARGVLHRDVKPANILMDKKDRPLLADFGLAKSVGDSTAGLTATGAVMGTPTYMSPEQAMASSLDGRSDQYSLGIIAFQLIAGVVPFTADSPLVVLHKHLQEPPPPPSRLNPKLSPAIDQVIERALRKNPADRYARCEDFSEALAEAFGGLGEVEQATQPLRTSERARVAAPKHGASENITGVVSPQRRRMGVLAGAAGLAAAMLAAILLWNKGKAPPGTSPMPSPAVLPPPSATAAASPTQTPVPLPPTLQAVAPIAPASPEARAAATPTSGPAPRARPQATAAPALPAHPTPAPVYQPTPVPPAPTAVSGTLWSSLFEAGQAALRAGDLRGAEKLFREAVAEAEKFPRSDARLMKTLERLSFALTTLSKYPEAEATLRRSLAIREEQPSSPALDVADIQVRLAFVLARQGKVGSGEAEALARRALATKEKALGVNDPAVAFALQQLAYCYEMQGRNADAEPLLMRALSILEKPPRTHEVVRAGVLNVLGWMYGRMGKSAQAEARLREALEIRQRVLGSDNPLVAQSAFNLATVETALKKYVEAEPLLRQALAIQGKTLGSDHPVVASTLEALARVLQATHRGAEADQLLIRARAIRARR